jgi:16S rRNA (guanine(527)-N(7))-methyltransferase RsmG
VVTAQDIVNKAVTEFPTLLTSPLLEYLQDILRWNPQLGLVSRKEPIEACERLVLESLELLTIVRDGGADAGIRCVDVGSGAGFPGLVWALAEPAWQFHLVERREGRAAFLASTVARLSLPHVEVFAGPVEEAAHHPGLAGAFGLATAMAVAPPADIGRRIEPLLSAAGRFFGTVPTGAEIPARIGKSLALQRSIAGDYGNYVEYQIAP